MMDSLCRPHARHVAQACVSERHCLSKTRNERGEGPCRWLVACAACVLGKEATQRVRQGCDEFRDGVSMALRAGNGDGGDSQHMKDT
eukprot:scaffold4406_cov112-Isochrysis_galbana.AAC.4